MLIQSTCFVHSVNMLFICELPILVKRPDLHVYPSLLDEDQVIKMGRGVVHMHGCPSPRRAILKHRSAEIGHTFQSSDICSV